MSIFKRGASKIWWYHFWQHGTHIQQSTRQTSRNIARRMEASHRARLAVETQEREAKAAQLNCATARVLRCVECERLYDGDAGIESDGAKLCGRECAKRRHARQAPAPTLAAFCARVESWSAGQYQAQSPNTHHWLRAGLRSILAYPTLAEKRLDEISAEDCVGFASHLQSLESFRRAPLSVNSVNASLQTLRRALKLAREWGVIAETPRIQLLRGARRRERVVSLDEEARYLAAAPEPLLTIATLLADSGLRPSEAYALRWENIHFENGRFGTLLVTHGKTKAARRMLPCTPRVRAVLESRYQNAGQPDEGWVFTAPTRSGHAEHSTVKTQHLRAVKLSKVRHFVLYSFRHTFLTRLAESGCDAWTLARIAGWSNIAMSATYVHPSEDAVLSAMAQLAALPAGSKPVV